MAADAMDRIGQIDDLFAAVWDLREAAKEKGDKDTVVKLTKQLDDIHLLRLVALQLSYRDFSARLSDMADKLVVLTQNVKDWPFGGTMPHEKQFRDRNLTDSDFEDEGPDSTALKPGTVAPDKVPTVASEWAANYQKLWDTMQVSETWMTKARAVAMRIVDSQAKYAAAVVGTEAPWWFVGVAHMMEGGLDFGKHLHNGDPLSARTVRHPAGRPAVIVGLPIDWVYSAKDAIVYERLDRVTDWSLPSVLYNWHRYNGIANEYKARKIPTPYLWSGTQHYVKGKYTSDHVFDPEAVSQQIGAAVILRALIDIKAVNLLQTQTQGTNRTNTQVVKLVGNPAAAVRDVASLHLDLSGSPFVHLAQELDYPGLVGVGSNDRMAVKRVQEWLYLHGFVTPIDSEFGDSTARQLERFANRHGRAVAASVDEELWALLTAPLRKALAPIHETPSFEEAIVRIAQQHIEQQPNEVGGNNCGPWVRAYMRGSEGKDQKWCAGFVSFVIEQAARDLKCNVPFPRQVGVNALVADAKKTKRFISENELSTPLLRQSKLKAGNLFVSRSSTNNWDHVGIMTSLIASTFDTLEGNTGGEGGTDGANAREGNRSFKNKDFLRIF